MREEELFRAFGEIEDEWIEEALHTETSSDTHFEVKRKAKNKRIWVKSFAGMAAAAVVLIIGMSGSALYRMSGSQKAITYQKEESIARGSMQEAKQQKTKQEEFTQDFSEQNQGWTDATTADPVTVISTENIVQETEDTETMGNPEIVEKIENPESIGNVENVSTEAEGDSIVEEESMENASLQREVEEYVEKNLEASAQGNQQEQPILEENVENSISAEQLSGLTIVFNGKSYLFTGEIKAEKEGELLGTIFIEELGVNSSCEVYGQEEGEEVIVVIQNQNYVLKSIFQEETLVKTEETDVVEEDESY